MKWEIYEFREFISQFLEAYYVLEKEKPGMINLFFVKAFLLGRVIELILKIQLLEKGYTLRQLKDQKQAGHNLISLLKMLGYPENYPMDFTTYDSVRHLNSYHVHKKYEYPHKTDVEVKNAKFLENFVNTSIEKIDAAA